MIGTTAARAGAGRRCVPLAGPAPGNAGTENDPSGSGKGSMFGGRSSAIERQLRDLNLGCAFDRRQVDIRRFVPGPGGCADRR